MLPQRVRGTGVLPGEECDLDGLEIGPGGTLNSIEMMIGGQPLTLTS
jgi:hypothetical protein